MFRTRPPSDRPAFVTALAVAMLLAPLSGCRMFAWPAAHTTAEHEAYYHRKTAEVDHCVIPDCNVEQANLFGEEPLVRTSLPQDLSPEERVSTSEVWYVSLPTAVRTAITNNKIIRQDAQFQSPGNAILNSVDFASSIFDPAIQDTNILFGNRGVAAAMSDFAPQLTGSYAYGRNDQVVNVGIPTPASDTTRSLNARLEKQLQFGGTLGIQHDLDFTNSNSPVVGLDSAYTGTIQADFTMPLWGASGTEFTQIAGPAAFISPRITSVNQGVLIARISSEVERVELERNIRREVKEVVDLYWDLSLAFDRVAAEEQAVEDAETILKKTRAGFDAGRTTAAEEAQAAQTFYAAQARAEAAFQTLDLLERRLRRLMGLDIYDGRLIRPADEPVVLRLPRMWNPLLSDALARRPELRSQKHGIRSLQLQLRAAHSLNKPRLDLVSSYRVNGFGESSTVTRSTPNVYESLTDGTLNGWTLGAQFSMPLGFQLSRAQIDNLQLRLSKSRAQLAEAEEEVAHELALAYETTQRLVRIIEANSRQRDAATRLVRSLEAEFEASRGDLDRLVRAQASQAQAEIAYRQSLTEFSKAIADLDYRRAALLEQSGVVLDFPNLPVAEDIDPRPRPLHALIPGHDLPPRLPSVHVTSDERLGPVGPPSEPFDRTAALPQADESTLGSPRRPSGDSPYDRDGEEPAEDEALAPVPELDSDASTDAADPADSPSSGPASSGPYAPAPLPDLFEETDPARTRDRPLLENDPSDRPLEQVPDELLLPDDADDNPFEDFPRPTDPPPGGPVPDLTLRGHAGAVVLSG